MTTARIHPTAIVDKGAELGEGVEIGPYSVVGAHVQIGKDTQVAHHVTLDGYTQIGQRCHIAPYACLGTPPQVRKQPARSYLKVGDDNIIREFVTMNPSMYEEGVTVVGNKNLIMINAHVAHDCLIGDEVTIANATGISGHVTIENNATIGGMTGITQHMRVGKYAMVGGLSKVSSDVPPFSTCDGNPICLYGINTLGLKRQGFSPEDRLILRKALKILLASDLCLSTSTRKAEEELGANPYVQYLLNFVKNSKRGIVRGNSFSEDKEE